MLWLTYYVLMILAFGLGLGSNVGLLPFLVVVGAYVAEFMMRLEAPRAKKAQVLVFMGAGLAFLPIIASILLLIPASVMGCQVDEGSPHSCIILGREFASFNYAAGVGSWFVFFTVPASIVLTLVMAVTAYIIPKFRKR